MSQIIGRESEVKRLSELYHTNEAQFLALYGRRRVGKTYLITEYFRNKGLFFDVTGIKNGTMHDQLENFIERFSEVFYPGLEVRAPKDWRGAFNLLTKALEGQPKVKKFIIFFDELPWLATKRSKFLPMLDFFWNTKWSKMPNMILIVCGSAASWMLEKIVNDKGGLHNRLTQTILLQPFSLLQTKQFLEMRKIKLNLIQILDIYMVMGGVPYYLKAIKRDQSATQTINHLCFSKNGLLLNEFENLFHSLFNSADMHIKIIRAIAKRQYGISRQELLKTLHIVSGGKINSTLNELVAAGFIQRYVPYGKKVKLHYYRIIDEYTLFYLNWIEPFKKDARATLQRGYWQKASRTPKVASWSGYSFEAVCHKHVHQIANALELDHVLWHVGSWRHITKKEGAQIDLLFDRDDQIITLCEIKYSRNRFSIDRIYAKRLDTKLELFEKHGHTHKALQLVMITASGTHHNVWYQDLIVKEVTLENLFT